MPLELASPFGKRFDFELSSSRGVSAPFAQTTTAFARWKISFLLRVEVLHAGRAALVVRLDLPNVRVRPDLAFARWRRRRE